MKKRKKRKNKTGRAEITLEKTERTLLRFGLELILNGLAGANAGSHPHAHPLALMSPQAANVYRNRAYNEEFAAKLISLRNRVSPDKGKKQFRLDAFDLAAAALGLRVTRKNQLWRQASDLDKRRLRRLADPPETDAVTLLRKLESARKRAERRIRKSIQEQHKELAKTWKAFVDWIRFNLLYVNEAQRQRIINREIGIPGSHRKLAKLRFQALLDAAREVIKERTTAQIPESELLRLVKLARNKSQPSRRPHNVGIVDLERDPEKAKDFMFDFIIDRDWEADGRRWELQEFVKSEPEVQLHRRYPSHSLRQMWPHMLPMTGHRKRALKNAHCFSLPSPRRWARLRKPHRRTPAGLTQCIANLSLLSLAARRMRHLSHCEMDTPSLWPCLNRYFARDPRRRN